MKSQSDYTVECLVQARKSLHGALQSEIPHAQATFDESTSASLTRRKSDGLAEERVMSPEALSNEFKRLMRLRQYDLVQKLLLKDGWGELQSDGNTFIHDLVEHGFVPILKGLLPLVKELSERLKDAEWCDKQKLASSKASIINVYPGSIGRSSLYLAPGSTQPLLLIACLSKQPNMKTVRFLVEEIGCDVNPQGYLRVPIPDTATGFGIFKHDTPIHALFRGKTHWWQTSEALPYLAQDHGASLEIRDCFHSTPLIVASAHIGRPSFEQQGLEKLIELGGRRESSGSGLGLQQRRNDRPVDLQGCGHMHQASRPSSSCQE